jgi:hypothetical protein
MVSWASEALADEPGWSVEDIEPICLDGDEPDHGH